MTTIEKLESIKKDLYHHIDELDDTFEECECCHLKTYTSKSESLTKRKLEDVIRGVNYEIEKIQNGKASVRDRN